MSVGVSVGTLVGGMGVFVDIAAGLTAAISVAVGGTGMFVGTDVSVRAAVGIDGGPIDTAGVDVVSPARRVSDRCPAPLVGDGGGLTALLPTSADADAIPSSGRLASDSAGTSRDSIVWNVRRISGSRSRSGKIGKRRSTSRKRSTVAFRS